MLKLHLDHFCAGVVQGLKTAEGMDINSMPMNENIIPNISSQAKWRYVRTRDGLKLTDGNLVYTFGMPESYPAEDSKVQRISDDNILNFDNDAVSRGTAQIHRAAPDNIYLTLADGSQNPTFALQHESEKQWRYIPSKKFTQKLKASNQPAAPAAPEESPGVSGGNAVLIDPNSLLEIGRAHV